MRSACAHGWGGKELRHKGTEGLRGLREGFAVRAGWGIGVVFGWFGAVFGRARGDSRCVFPRSP